MPGVIKAVHDTDLEKVLRKLGLYDKIARGELRCSICGQKLSIESLGGMYRDEKRDLKLVCDRITCLVRAAEEVASIRARASHRGSS